ncbi:hypothetical protein [Cellulosilyticum ruminicola]|uniref:hypothetical protein n=1 Tax=Cellulosilyticum ruminicola TaxID=425254 RepID=UPI0012EEDF4E|nr:hypothetical protein [Cellulosilyticum ruminicola]
MRMIIEEDGVTGEEILQQLSDDGMALSEEIVEDILNLESGYLRYNDSTGNVVALKRRN